MRVILRGRQGGKTHDLIQMSAILNVPILAPTPQWARYVEKMAADLKILIPKPISPADAEKLGWGSGHHYDLPKEVVVDDADAIIRELFERYLNVTPVAMAMTQYD